ncbi:kinase-like domain-containing protein [Mycena galopus ATCC 62051]|nr:kinase-like domain-containing protein [Mycena galopus ATCC 62051]
METSSKDSETNTTPPDRPPVSLSAVSESIDAADGEADAIPAARKITIVEPEKPTKVTTDADADEAPVASTSREGSPPAEEEDASAEDHEGGEDGEDGEDGGDGDKGDFEKDDEEDELEEAYFWHDQIIGELRRVCREGDPLNAYKILDNLSVDQLGRTSYTARASRTGETVVVKSNVLEAPIEKFAGQRLITELFLMRDMLSHRNVLSFYDLYLVEESEVLLVTEYIAGGHTLGDIIANTASKFTEEQIARICVETCQGLAHLHSQLIIHRDMRSDSIIIDAKGRVKITGLAFSVQLPDKAAKRRTMVSTLSLPNRSPYTVDKTHWTAPEVIKRKEYGFEVDVWAFGITMVEMIDGAPPYAGQEPLKVLFLILVNGAPELKAPDALSDELKDFLSDCLAVDVAQRPSTSELLEHEFLKKACPPGELAPLFEFKPKLKPEEVPLPSDDETLDSAEASQPTDSTAEAEPSAASQSANPLTAPVVSESQDSAASPHAKESTEVTPSAVLEAVDSPLLAVVGTSPILDAAVDSVVELTTAETVEGTGKPVDSVAPPTLNPIAPDASTSIAVVVDSAAAPEV